MRANECKSDIVWPKTATVRSKSNTLMQTLLNPLMALVSGGENLASQLTFGQFVKAIASFMAPLIAGWGYKALIPTFGLDWRVLFAIYFVVSVVVTLLLWTTPIHEEQQTTAQRPAIGTQFVNCFRLLGTPVVLLSFLGIMCHVGAMPVLPNELR